MSQPTNLILGVCVGYAAESAEAFVRSFSRNVPSAALHLFTKDITPSLAALLREFGIGNTDCAMALELAADLGFNIYSARHFILRHFLRRHTGYSRILLSDVRDVLFQSDPFALPLPGEVLFAAEDKLIRDCPTNSSWIRQAYGEDVTAILRRHPVSCAGTVLATYSGMLRYLDTSCDEIRRHPRQEVDQGIHNFIAWGLQPPGMAVDESDSIIATLDQTPAERVAFRDGLVLVDGCPPAIVHQWDRQDHLRGPVVRAWRQPRL